MSLSAFCIQFKPQFSYPQVIDPAQQQVTVNQKGRTERIFVNLEAIYPTPELVGTELSLEELRAVHRGWFLKVWTPETNTKSHDDSQNLRDDTGDSNIKTGELSREVSERLVIAHDPLLLDENGAAKESSRERKGRRMKIKEVNETQISKTNCRERHPDANKTQ